MKNVYFLSDAHLGSRATAGRTKQRHKLSLFHSKAHIIGC